jgi:hypothetical protein
MVMQIDISRHNILKPRNGCPKAEVVILVVACAELDIQIADLLEQSAVEQHAETDHSAGINTAMAVCNPEASRKPVKIFDALVGSRTYALYATGIIGKRANNTGAWSCFMAVKEPVQPLFGYDHIVVEQDQPITLCQCQTLIAAGGKAAIIRIKHNPQAIISGCAFLKPVRSGIS